MQPGGRKVEIGPVTSVDHIELNITAQTRRKTFPRMLVRRANSNFIPFRKFIFGTTNITRNALNKPYEQIQMRGEGLVLL